MSRWRETNPGVLRRQWRKRKALELERATQLHFFEDREAKAAEAAAALREFCSDPKKRRPS